MVRQINRGKDLFTSHFRKQVTFDRPLNKITLRRNPTAATGQLVVYVGNDLPFWPDHETYHANRCQRLAGHDAAAQGALGPLVISLARALCQPAIDH
jgi:hypothetical protein